VVAVRFDAAERALGAWRDMLANGVYVNLIVPPASPDGSSLLRCSVSAAHTAAQIDVVIEAFAAVTR
jgi:8-amino-7-oxononanoate synthase